MSGSVITPSISEPQAQGDVSLGFVTRLLDTLDKSLLVSERSGRILMVNSRARKCLDSLQLGDFNRLNLFTDLLEVDAKRIFADIESGQHEVKLDLARGEKRTCASIQWVPEPDWLVVELKNEITPAAARNDQRMPMAIGTVGAKTDPCAGGIMMDGATNLHFHGLAVPPVCHQDEATRTMIAPGAPTFEYRMRIPENTPPGLYWYHPHPHGFSERQVLGGASGALIVEGIEHAAAQVAGLPERVLVLRDQLIGGVPEDSAKGDGDEPYVPSLDLSLNFVPILYPLYKPAVLLVRPQQREFWRVLNASADTFFNLQLLDWPNPDTQVAQPIQVIAIDGVPVGADFAIV